ncbi:MAG: VOC family protein [Devosia sp.]|uniref:VOC family protein n=1 Tax=Devosia sp. TaxID=1871048 RepID=UPI001AD2DA16|nr:VOC family protein [Devosia sp.]MBN9316306.1 VOC family protein [Devosia sp.]
MTDANEFFDMRAAPMRIGTVRLKVRDLDAVSSYYKALLGLNEVSRNDREVVLGSGKTPLLGLESDRNLAANDRRQAGLFHTAFLMPTRGDLARWLRHVADEGIRLQGASDHIVSEALYLADPEGNGIEVYVDRPVAQWLDAGGNIQMSTDPLDVQDLLGAAGDRTYLGFPEQGSIGHVHLQVGDTRAADRFYSDVLGLVSTVDYPGASFYGSGGYHHQLAGNVWNSRGASRRPAGMAGLDGVEIIVKDPAEIGRIVAKAEAAGIEAVKSDAGTTLRDPWGTALTLKN